MEEAHVYAVDLEATLTARAGAEWYREAGADAVGKWFEGL
jgi:hypothetical protein